MEKIEFMSSLLTFYLKGEIVQEQNFIRLKKPNTILAFIPLGAKKESVPINQIASVDSDFSISVGQLILGAVLLLIGFLSLLDTPIIGIILMLLGFITGVNAFHTVLEIKTTSGSSKLLSFIIFEKAKAEAAENQINYLISNRLDDTNNRQQTDRVVEAINNLNKN
ncbi:MAG: hypothetical protein ACI4J4_08825 [Ruminiclostridium sp.]